MEPRGLWPWEIAVICGVLVVAAYVMGSTSKSEAQSQNHAEEKPSSRDEEVERLRKAQDNHLRESAAQMQKLTLELQTLEASRTLEKQSLQAQQAETRQELLETKAKLRSEEEARESLEETLRDAKEKMRDLERDYKALERRFEEELPALRAGFQRVSYDQPSLRVMAQRSGSADLLSPREARIQEWRRRFQRGQEARDAFNAWLEKERESDFLWANSRMGLEDGSAIDWPLLLTEPGFVSFRHQAERAVQNRDLNQLEKASNGALILLESRAREHGRSTESYLSAKRFLNVLRQLAI